MVIIPVTRRVKCRLNSLKSRKKSEKLYIFDNLFDSFIILFNFYRFCHAHTNALKPPRPDTPTFLKNCWILFLNFISRWNFYRFPKKSCFAKNEHWSCRQSPNAFISRICFSGFLISFQNHWIRWALRDLFASLSLKSRYFDLSKSTSLWKLIGLCWCFAESLRLPFVCRGV